MDAKPCQSYGIDFRLTEQITASVRWTDAIGYLLAQGEAKFIEVGLSNILTGLIRHIKNGQ